MLEHLLRWLRRHEDLPLVRVESAAVTDDDTEFFGDVRYMQDLLDETHHLCITTHEAIVQPLSPILSSVLELQLEIVRDDARWEIDLGVVAK